MSRIPRRGGGTYFLAVQIDGSRHGAHDGGGDREQRPEELRGELPHEAVARSTCEEPADAEQRVPAELALDYCGG